MAPVIPMQCSTSWWAGSWSLCKFVIYSYATPYHPQCTYSDFHVFTIKNTSYCHVQADDWVNFPSNVDVTPHTEEIQEPHKQRTYVTWCYYSLIPSAFTKLLFFFFQGWYEAEVQSFDYDDNEIKLIFLDEPGHVYSIPVLPSLISGTLRLKKLFW